MRIKWGGDIRVTSEKGKGSVFVVTLAFEIAEEKRSEETSAAADVAGLRLLLAEDNELNADIIRTLLADYGITTDTAQDGRKALELFESHVPLSSVTVMVQEEVADRMKAEPGTKAYGALSLAVQYYAKPTIAAHVPPNCFMPRPGVGSAVITLNCLEATPVEVKNEKLMFKLIRASFNQRRKTLQNGLTNSSELPFSKEEVGQAIQAAGLPAAIRGEKLGLSEFAALANYFEEMKQSK